MQVRADRVSLEGPHGTLLPPTSLTVSDGQFAIMHGEPSVGMTAFGLALAGRIKPTTGHVTIEGEQAPARELVAVVDAPGVSEPDDALSLRVVVGEELALAHLPASKDDVAAWLAANDLSAFASTRFENVEPALRTRLLSALAASRPGVRVLVLDTPDRHTSDVESWARLAREHAERGLAVVVLSATTPASALPHPAARIGEREQPEPLQCAPVPVPAQEVEETAPLEADVTAEGDQA